MLLEWFWSSMFNFFDKEKIISDEITLPSDQNYMCDEGIDWTVSPQIEYYYKLIRYIWLYLYIHMTKVDFHFGYKRFVT